MVINLLTGVPLFYDTHTFYYSGDFGNYALPLLRTTTVENEVIPCVDK